ncbi:HvfC/BufC N-terminal domain-containing protein [Candidatus Entotheonella palauensis]|uniref:Putative DNA-binding domain-containing protein n=1 Tax=Candidatus Entotheonella gemina TaxID=1429439 RepID=W4LJD3_9BACT|nr:DNA-binding domain-containing protein [Candidatus Entotheonella palauensis]ETW97790.1 MAG: hypothetical protein ETSY2_43935 [Candidatus Entotheonella gemina]
MEQTLAPLQRWMQAVITHPHGVMAGTQSEAAQREIAVSPEALDAVITPSQALSAGDRLAIYHWSYYLRLVKCLAEMLPVLQYALGEELFEQFAVEYLVDRPPRNYTLYKLDEDFVQFLRETRPDRDLPPAERELWPEFMIDLATLEHALRVVFDGPGNEGEPPLKSAFLEALSPAQFARLQLVPAPCLTLYRFHFPVHFYLQAVRAEQHPQMPQPKPAYVALNRSNYMVHIYDLTPSQYAVLVALLSGDNVTQAMARRADTVSLTDLKSWLSTWIEAGFFRTLPII